MNLALERTEEYVNGKKTNVYGDAFIRGNNGMVFILKCFDFLTTVQQSYMFLL